MKAPDIIYLQTCSGCRNHELCQNECEECKFDGNSIGAMMKTSKDKEDAAD